MRKPLSPNRRRAAAFGGAAAALSGSFSLLHQHQPADVSDLAFGALVGVSIGAMLAASVVLILRDRRACSRS